MKFGLKTILVELTVQINILLDICMTIQNFVTEREPKY